MIREHKQSKKKGDSDSCLFCNVGLLNGCLNACSTFNIDQNIKNSRIFGDIDLLSKLEGGTDHTGMEIKYHIACYTNF